MRVGTSDGTPAWEEAETEDDAGATPLDQRLADRLARYVHGSLSGLFDGQTTVRLDNRLVVFSIRDLDGDLRPLGLWLVSDFVWTRMHQEQGRQPRLLLIDEAWTLAQRPEGGQFLASLARRARKYYLGLVTITQDVGDFLQNADGRTVLNQASIHLLLMQSSATIEQIVETFRLTQGERNYLLSCPKGHGLLFANSTHVAIRIEASPFEHALATTNPRERAAQAVQATHDAQAAPSWRRLAEVPVVDGARVSALDAAGVDPIQRVKGSVDAAVDTRPHTRATPRRRRTKDDVGQVIAPPVAPLRAAALKAAPQCSTGPTPRASIRDVPSYPAVTGFPDVPDRPDRSGPDNPAPMP